MLRYLNAMDWTLVLVRAAKPYGPSLCNLCAEHVCHRNVLLIRFLRFLSILMVGEFYSMFVHKAGQCEYFSVFSFKIRVIFAEEIQS